MKIAYTVFFTGTACKFFNVLLGGSALCISKKWAFKEIANTLPFFQGYKGTNFRTAVEWMIANLSNINMPRNCATVVYNT